MTTGPHTPPPRDTVERTFAVSVPVEAAWTAMTDPDEIAKWFFAPVVEDDTPSGFDTYGNQATINVLDAEPLRSLRYSETGGPVPKLDGYAEVTVTFEEEGSGTRITITRSGFGDGPVWDAIRRGVRRGLEESIADFVLYVEAGVSFPRHPMGARAGTGILGLDTSAGLEVVAVGPGTFGARLGLEPGDLLVEMGGAPIFDQRELAYLQRLQKAGDRITATWARQGQLHQGTAELDPWRPIEWSEFVTTGAAHR